MASSDGEFIGIVEISKRTGLSPSDVLAKAIENKVMILAKLDGEIVYWTAEPVEVAEQKRAAEIRQHKHSIDSFQPWTWAQAGDDAQDDEDHSEGMTQDERQLHEAMEYQRQAFASQLRNTPNFSGYVRLTDAVGAFAENGTLRVVHVRRWPTGQCDLPYGLILDGYYQAGVELAPAAIGLTAAGWVTLAQRENLPRQNLRVEKKRTDTRSRSQLPIRRQDLELVAILVKILGSDKTKKAAFNISTLTKRVIDAPETGQLDGRQKTEFERVRKIITKAIQVISGSPTVTKSAAHALIGALATKLKEPGTPERRQLGAEAIAAFTHQLCAARGLDTPEYAADAILGILKAAKKQ